MRRNLAILLALCVAVGAVVGLALFREPTLGLDLQGGLEVVLEAEPTRGQELSDDDLDDSIEIMRERVDRIGVGEPNIVRQGDNQIVIQLPGVTDASRAAELVGQTAQLEFYDLEADVSGPSVDAQGFPVANDRLLPLLSSQSARLETVDAKEWYLYSEDRTLLAGPVSTQEELLTDLALDEAPEGATFYGLPEDRIILTCGPGAVVCPGVAEAPPTRTYYYLFKFQPDDIDNPIPELTGADLERGGTRADFGQANQPIVTLEFTDRGGDKFHDITRELAQRGQFRTNQFNSEVPILQHFAIVLDGEIRSFPTIDFNENPDGIAGGRAQITGLDSFDEAENLELVLRSGALPVEFVQLERSEVSATLGQDSLDEAVIALVAGFAAVALFLLVVYRLLGLVALIGLSVYGILLYGAIVLIDVTLTLPGFAGLVLSIGVATDANIVIFERIKEEVRAGKTVRAAITAGYRKGFRTIVDANVVTMITAFVIFLVAIGGVKGFALMLLLGTAISMFTAIVATRALLGVLGGFRWFDNPRLMGAKAGRIPAWQKIDFVGKRRLWFALSAVILTVGFVALGIRGLNLGIEFDGGTQVTFKTEEAFLVEDVRADTAEIVGANAVIQGRGEEAAGGFTEFRIRTETLEGVEQDALTNTLTTEFSADAIGVTTVSGSFSSQILRNAIIAVGVSLLLIVIYITVRFQWKFAVPVVVALLHDVLVAVGLYALTGREVTAATVAAILTILGYSVYDTIIIFDRVRENMNVMRKSSFAAITNQSLWEVLRRSLATTFTTLLPITALLLFGGDTLKDFAFALLVGILAGSYSSIFVAAPLLSWFKEREPEWLKRKGAGLQEKLDEPTLEAEPELTEEADEVEEGEILEPAAEELAEAGVGAEPVADAGDGNGSGKQKASAEDRRAARKKRRRSRPHGRAR